MRRSRSELWNWSFFVCTSRGRAAMKTSQLLIRTPEGIVFSQLLAGPVTRFLAWGLDFLAITGLTLLLGRISTLVNLFNADAAGTVSVVGYFVISIGYGIFLEWAWRGQTLGKKLLR